MSRLDIENFFKLPDEEKEAAYNRLSRHDQLGVRMAISVPGDIFIPCNVCKHRIGRSFSCKAYPDGLPGDAVRERVENHNGPCTNGYRFEASE